MPDQLTDRARKAAKEIAVQVMRSVGAMYSENDQAEARKQLVEFLAAASDEDILREFSSTITVLSERILAIMERNMKEAAPCPE